MFVNVAIGCVGVAVVIVSGLVVVNMVMMVNNYDGANCCSQDDA